MFSIRATVRSVLVAAISMGLCGARAIAQEPATRAEELARQQEEKARTLAPYQPNFVERKILEIENAGGFGVKRGLFVTAGDIKSGSGAALGPAYGRTFGNGAVVEVKGALSIELYKLAQVMFIAPPMAQGRLLFSSRARYQDAPGGPVYALGADSEKVRADYAETKNEVSGLLAFRPVRLLRFGAGLAYEGYRTGPADTGNPSVETMFPTLPGLEADPKYLHSRGSAGIDSRDGDFYSRRGSLLRVTLHDYREQTNRPFTFQRIDSAAEQYVPILRGNMVLYVALHTSTTHTDGDNTVPFFLMPSLGGRELRGFNNYRFRDRNSLVATGEYRWYVQEYLDGAFFYDTGKVAPRPGALDFDDLEHDYGVGIRLHTPLRTLLRVELAHSREGNRFIISFNATGG